MMSRVVGSPEEAGVDVVEPAGAGVDVGKDQLVGAAEMWFGVHVRDRHRQIGRRQSCSPRSGPRRTATSPQLPASVSPRPYGSLQVRARVRPRVGPHHHVRADEAETHDSKTTHRPADCDGISALPRRRLGGAVGVSDPSACCPP